MPAAFSVTANIMSSLKLFVAVGSHRGTLFYRSGSAEKRDTAPQGNIARKTDRHFFLVDYDRDLHLSPGVAKHLPHLLRIFMHINVNGPFAIGCPSLFAIGSRIRAVNNDLVCHANFLLVPRLNRLG